MLARAVLGDDINIKVTILTSDGTPEDLSSATLVEARLVDDCKEVVQNTITTLSSSAVGADWANGIVMVSIPSADTLSANYSGWGYLEIQITESTMKRTRHAQVQIVQGTIV